MTAPLTPDETEQAELPELPFPSAPVEELLRSLLKAVRAHQLYLPNNPIYKSSIDNVRAAFSPVWQETDELALTFTETDVLWYGHSVLHESTKSGDSLPWLFYKDGVREVTLVKGIEQEELLPLLGIIQRGRKASPDDDDLLAMLWEQDFVNLRYRYVDLGLEPASPVEDGGPPPRPMSPEEVRQANAGGGADDETEESRPGVVNLADFDSTLYFLDEKEIDYLQSEIGREYAADLRQVVAATLFDIFEAQADGEVRAEVSDLIETLMLYMLAGGHLRTVAYLLRESQVAATRGKEVTPEQRDRVGQVPARLSQPEPLGQLLQALDESTELPPQEELTELFEQLRADALGPIFSWLGRLQNQRLRPMLEQAAARLTAANTTELVKLIQSEDRAVVMEAVRRCGALKIQAGVAAIGRVMGSADAELRLACVQALGEIGSAGALQALEPWVANGDRDTRVAAVRLLATRGYRPVQGRIEAAVKGKEIREADLTERVAFFEAYGMLSGDSAVPFLDGILNGKGFLGRREDAEVRACAAMALGRVGTDAAQQALRRASSEKDVVVRNAVNKALRGGSA
ncbi:MAG: HEAT repeat domain-containing protein [Gemmatimonadota bacterium]|nr:HEAT repeat domain-containing protein [Gemmatimonadota bacterium]MDE3216781.1 HEAT repeat domain-containing protein [Gemmatimonadota bacterium]